MALLLVTLLLLTLMCCELQVRADHANKYKGYTMVRLHLKNNDHVTRIKRFLDSHEDMTKFLVHFASGQMDEVDIVVSPEQLKEMLLAVEHSEHVPYDTVHSDVQAAIKNNMAENTLATVVDHDDDFQLNRYHTYDEIQSWMQKMATRHPDQLSVDIVGTSWEGRPIRVMKVKSPTSTAGLSKPAIWLDGGIHSNEWISPATLVYFIKQFVSSYGVSEPVTQLLNDFDVYVLPLINVDGYVYAWTQDRLWRKSRSVRANNSECIGVDLNRNWNVHWKDRHVVRGCGHTYSGLAPHSEPEVTSLVTYFQQRRDVIHAYITYHSYSQYWMMPRAYAKKRPADFQKLCNISEAAIKAIQAVHGTKYTYGTVADLIGIAKGTSVDYANEVLGIKYTFGVELRDTGTYGMLLPPDQIVPNAEESLAGLLAVAQAIRPGRDK